MAIEMLIVGDWSNDQQDGALPVDAATQAKRAVDLPAALEQLRGREVPQLILLSEPRPGIWNESAVRALRSAAPLARLLRISGSWCEGQARSGRPPSGCPGMYWHQVAARLANEFARAASGSTPGWAQPLTATADEQLLAGLERARTIDRGKTVVVWADSAACASALCTLCERAGFASIVVDRAAPSRTLGACAALWDTSPDALHDESLIDRLRTQVPNTPVVALVGFPRPEDVRAGIAAGLAAVVSKPYLVADLVECVQKCAGECADAGR